MRTELADGRTVCVAGEHEDFYDPDFCIYNDVVVLGPGGSVEIFGYPEDLFPPTDFHTATHVDGRLILIGRVGYQGERTPGTTPVFALNLDSYRIEPLPSRGDVPGWLFRHEAEHDPSRGVIVVRGGEVEALAPGNPGERVIRRNFDEFAYHVASGTWERLTTKGWRLFSIRGRERRSFMLTRRSGPAHALMMSIRAQIDQAEDTFAYIELAAILPEAIAHEVESLEPFHGARIRIDGVPVSIGSKIDGVEVIVEGDLGPGRAEALAREILRRVEADSGQPCVLETLA